jgi:hypothetical protein
MTALPGEQTEALVILAAALDAVGVEYYVTGSVAAAVYGMARMSADIDVVIDVPPPHEREPLARVLSEDFDVEADTVLEALREPRMFNLLTKHTVAKIDIIPRNRMLDPEEVLERRRRVELPDGSLVSVISPEDRIISKLHWSKDSKSDMQKRDIQWVLGREGTDIDYVTSRAAALGLSDWLREIRR